MTTQTTKGIPSIPDVPPSLTLDDIRRILEPLAHLISIRQGRFDPLDRWVTQQDLINAGLQTTETVEAPVIIEAPAASYPFTLQGDIAGGPTTMGSGNPTFMQTAINLPNVVVIDGGDSVSTFPGEVTGPYGVVEFSLESRDEGIQVVADTKIIDFTGAGVTVTNPSGNQIRVDIPGGGGGGLDPGTVVNSTLRWSGSAWVEETGFEIDVNGGIARLGSQNDVSINNNIAGTVLFDFGIGATSGTLRTGVGASNGHRIQSGNNLTITDANGDTMLDYTKNGGWDIYYNDVLNAQTYPATLGGFRVNNTLTGLGLERVLTESDASGGTISKGVSPFGIVGSGLASANISIIEFEDSGGTVDARMGFVINGNNLFDITADPNNAQIRIGTTDPVNTTGVSFLVGNTQHAIFTASTFLLREEVDIAFEEKAANAATVQAGRGYLWVRNDTPNVLVFTDDTGADTVLGAGGGGGIGGSIADNQVAVGALTADEIEGTANLTFDDASTTLTIGGTEPRLDLGTKAYISGSGGVALLIQADSGGAFVMQQRVNGGIMRFGCDDSGGSFRKNYEADADQIELFATNGTRRMLIDGAQVLVDNNDLVIRERADHASTIAAGYGYLWVRNDAPNKLIFTDDAGTDFDLTAGGGGIGGSIAATQIAVGSTTADEIEGSSLLIFNSGSSFLGIGGGTAAFASATVNVSATGSANLILQQNSVTKAFLTFDNTAQDLFIDSDGDIVFYPGNSEAGKITSNGFEVDGNPLSYTNTKNKIARSGATDSFTGLGGAQWVEVFIEDYDPQSTNAIWFRPEYSTGTVQTTGYNSYCLRQPGGSAANVTSGAFTNTFSIVTAGATGLFTGSIRFTKADDNTNEWVARGEFIDTVNDEKYTVTGHVLLSGALTGIRINNSAATTGDTGDLYCIWGT